DTIDFSCSGIIPFTSQITINKIITIEGGGTVTFDGGDITRFFSVNAGQLLTLNDLTLQNGMGAGGGGAISNHGSLIINNST
ncbi:MAG TPA: hypothetical protein PLZ51_27635, partial [Aggregatilineales bacterium]|nr:hypothetical protein [Aggregatilineales bacterium]